MDRQRHTLAKKARDSIEETEKMVREVISKVMTSSHGPTLVGTSMGFSEQEIKELEQRRKDERDKLSSQPTSSKILDYTNIVDLKRIIQDNWQEFSPIFLSKDTTMVYLDTLNKDTSNSLKGFPFSLLFLFQ